MEQIVSTKAVTGCTPQREFLELPLQFRRWNDNGTEKIRPLCIIAEICVSKSRLLGRNDRLPGITILIDVQLKCVQEPHAVEPRER